MEGQDSGRSEDPGVHNFPEGLRSLNLNSHEHLPSRHAKELFEDFTNRLLKLQWIPSSEDRRMLSEWDEEVFAFFSKCCALNINITFPPFLSFLKFSYVIF